MSALATPTMPNDGVKSIFVEAVRNAHALENEALSIMNRQIERLKNYPALSERLERHVGETEGQIARLEQILGELGEDPSTFKDTVMSIGGSIAALGHTAASDEVLKNAFADFAFENFEIAAYRSLITLTVRDPDLSGARALLETSLEEERGMAR
ncbi:ferritin-like domain-containing protein [Mangrovicella endophytica]|uniref:ferritin-like domain-containing protein n=1 Tax=Mangrovicella endophytica TaxID=2066697 RepID=UPI00315A1CB5